MNNSMIIRRSIRLLCPLLLVLGISLSLPAPAANANYLNDLYNGLETFSELPGEVNKLQDSYQQTMEELQQTKDELGNTMNQLGQTQQEMETYRSQNAALQEQNRQLTQMVDELRDDRAARESYLNRIKVTIFTGIGLVLGYFVLIRLIRFGMRHRSRRGDRLL
ncbi:hypothetical protein [Paenibacillus donghaensis]|uniref:DUF3450 domain-containing protein n=1 Tax=Paenibacillus donghaensis TaxID=414771 RepID=A0A2Z2KGX8_9BACL|nr:hypothetical protein [Paenibacillus donghaensis]ASA26036.1 hypothetical protein B9T62_38215 [Paenibacillus donghaensis]